MRIVLSVVLSASLLLLPVVSARAVRGREAGCGCYCGKVISPPCSDGACKRACGYRSGSSSRSRGRSGSFPWGRVTPIEWEKAKRCRGNLYCWVTSGLVVVYAVLLDSPWLIGKGLYYGGRGFGRGAVYVGKGVGKGVAVPGKKFKRWRRNRAYAKRNSVSSSCASVLYKSQEDLRRAERKAEKFGFTFVKDEFKDAVKELGASLAKKQIKEMGLSGYQEAMGKTGKAMEAAKKVINTLKEIQSLKACYERTQSMLECAKEVNQYIQDWLAGFGSDGDKAAYKRVKKAEGFLKGFTARLTKNAERNAKQGAACGRK